MDPINQLLVTIDRLLGPDGCSWDRKQTLSSVKSDLLEETCEVIDAIEANDPVSIREEIGDLLFVTLFLSRLAEKESVSSLSEIATEIREKLIRRHPHVFEQKTDLTHDGHIKQWEEIKKKEKGPRHPLERIPKSLPALARAHEIALLKIKHAWKSYELPVNDKALEIGKKLKALAEEASHLGIDPEMALRKYLSIEESFLKQNHPESS